LFRRKDTGQWAPALEPKETVLSIADAIAIAHKHRDQFVTGARILEEFRATTDDASYQTFKMISTNTRLTPAALRGGTNISICHFPKNWMTITIRNGSASPGDTSGVSSVEPRRRNQIYDGDSGMREIKV
jgi:hypothetical protein